MTNNNILTLKELQPGEFFYTADGSYVMLRPHVYVGSDECCYRALCLDSAILFVMCKETRVVSFNLFSHDLPISNDQRQVQQDIDNYDSETDDDLVLVT